MIVSCYMIVLLQCRGTLALSDSVEIRRQGVRLHSPVRRLINTFQGRLDIPLSDAKRQHHMKGEYRLEGVRQVGCRVACFVCQASSTRTAQL